MPKQQKKQKFSNMRNNKENNNSSTELTKEDNKASQKPLTNVIEPEPMLVMLIQVEQTIEQETTWDPIEKKTQDTNPPQKEEYDYAPTPDMEIDNVGININNTEEQIQVTMECPDEEEYQVTMGPSLDTNGTEVEMNDTIENDLVTPEMQMAGVFGTKDKMVAQHDNPGESTTPTYMRGNEDLKDELNILSFTNDTAAQSNDYAESHTLKTAIKATQLEDTEWLHS
ncbi:28485_t:CDS:2, partial [Gigaspora margarita]